MRELRESREAANASPSETRVILNTQCGQNAVPSHDSGDVPGNWWCRNNLPRERGQISSRNNEARVNNTVNSTEYFGTSFIDDFNSSSSTVPCKTQPIDSLASFPYRFLVVCYKTCFTKIGFYCFRCATTHLAISFNDPAIGKKNSNACALMSPV